MKKLLIGLAALASLPAFSAEEPKERSQDVYLAIDVTRHELKHDSVDLDMDGNRFGLLFGARNVFSNGLFYGGEIQAYQYDNDSDTYSLDEQYGYGGVALAGKQLKLSDNGLKVNFYGLMGYSAIRTEEGSVTTTLDGVQWGGGVDTILSSDWMIGARYTQTNLDGDLEEQNISLTIGYKLSL